MNLIRRIATLFCLLCFATPLQAQEFSTDAPTDGVTIETSVLWPFFPGNLYMLRAAVPVGRGELLVGAQGRIPEQRPEEGKFNNLDVQLGWRQNLAYGLHIDGLLNLGWGHIEDSTIDGKDYDSFDGEVMAVAGWRISFGPAHLLLQPVGFGYVFYKSNPWPIEGEGKPAQEGPIYVGNVVAGWHF